MIIVDKDGNIIEGATQIAKPDAKSLDEEMISVNLQRGKVWTIEQKRELVMSIFQDIEHIKKLKM